MQFLCVFNFSYIYTYWKIILKELIYTASNNIPLDDVLINNSFIWIIGFVYLNIWIHNSIFKKQFLDFFSLSKFKINNKSLFDCIRFFFKFRN